MWITKYNQVARFRLYIRSAQINQDWATFAMDESELFNFKYRSRIFWLAVF